ncbi:MAG: hypothetical protein RIE31_08765 [Alphaproteobacteria bacterium]
MDKSDNGDDFAGAGEAHGGGSGTGRPARVAAPADLLLQARAGGFALRVGGGGLVAAALRLTMPGWHHSLITAADVAAEKKTDVAAGEKTDAALEVRRLATGIAVRGPLVAARPAVTRHFRHELEAANGLAGAVVEVVALRPDRAVLHAAAVRTAAGVVVLAGDSGAGKSTLAQALAWRGARHLADDRIVLDLSPATVASDGVQCISLGLAARARLPLPEALGPELRQWISRRTVETSGPLAWLDPHDRAGAVAGEAAALAALYVLDRRTGTAGVRLVATDGGDDAALVALLLPQLHAPGVAAGGLVATVQRLLAAARAGQGAGRLVYGATLEAADWLIARHGLPPVGPAPGGPARGGPEAPA